MFLILDKKRMGTPNKDIVIKDDAPSELLLEKHLNFLVSYSEKKNDYEYVVTGTVLLTPKKRIALEESRFIVARSVQIHSLDVPAVLSVLFDPPAPP